jgi:hypothetical protein
LLLNAIAIRGPHNWSQIAQHLPHRNEKQCRERYVNQLNPDMRKGSWTLQEDSTIVEMYTEIGSVRLALRGGHQRCRRAGEMRSRLARSRPPGCAAHPSSPAAHAARPLPSPHARATVPSHAVVV